jgi:hypothetical protein
MDAFDILIKREEDSLVNYLKIHPPPPIDGPPA